MFLTGLSADYSYADKRWVLTKPLVYQTQSSAKFEVPVGHSTDLDSVPRIPFVYAYLKGRAVRSAVLHDYLYSMYFPRKQADKIFLAAMKEEGIGFFRRHVIYRGVRMFGWLAYREEA